MFELAYNLLMKVSCVSRFNLLNQAVIDYRNDPNITSPSMEVFHAFSNEALMDVVKAGICFENYLKGLMISKGYLVHIIKKPKTNSNNFEQLFKLKKKQDKKIPIYIEEYKEVDQFTYDVELKQNTLKGLSDKTINYSWLIQEIEYQKILNTKSEVLSESKNLENREIYFIYCRALHGALELLKTGES